MLSHYEWNTGIDSDGFSERRRLGDLRARQREQNLPAFVVIYDARGGPFCGPANWNAGFLPAAYQGTVFRSVGDPILDLSPPSQYMTPEQEKAGWIIWTG